MLKLITAATVEPVTVEEAKLHLRVDHSDEDGLIGRVVQVAREDAETICLHKFITQTWDWYLDEFPAGNAVELPMNPVQSITGIWYTPEDGAETEFASSNYATDVISKPARIKLKSTASWPSDELEVMNGVRIRMVVGMGDDPADVDVRAIQAMMLMIGHYYENREQVVIQQGGNVVRLPDGAASLLMNLRMEVVRY